LKVAREGGEGRKGMEGLETRRGSALPKLRRRVAVRQRHEQGRRG